MAIQPIRTSSDHDAALWDARPDSPQHDELEVLSVLVSAFEDEQ